MSEEQSQENDVQSDNKKYIALGIALLLIGVLAYFFLIPKDTTEDTTKEDPVAGEKVVDEAKEEEEDTDVLGEKDSDEDAADEAEEFFEEEILLADLYIEDFYFEDDPKQNEEVTVKIKIGNRGDATATKFYWEWWPTEDDRECEDNIDELDVGDTETVECKYTYTGSDTYESRVVIDGDDDIDESDEDNNIETMEVTPEEEMKADLYISEYSFDPVPEKAVPFTVRIGIKNKGNASSGEFWWEWWGTAYNYACREKISELAPNSEKVVTCDYTYGGWSTYPTKAVADADDDVDEFDEDNNEYTEDVVPIH